MNETTEVRVGKAQLTIEVPYDVDNDPHPRRWNWEDLTDTPGVKVLSSRDSSLDPVKSRFDGPLTRYAVSITDSEGGLLIEFYSAESHEHAIEQAKDANPDGLRFASAAVVL